MPAKNVIKTYKANSYYHILHQGINRGKIFKEFEDVKTFIEFIKLYLSPKDTKNIILEIHQANNWEEKQQKLRQLQLSNHAENIALVAYCLMVNRVHFIVHQKNEKSIEDFMRALNTKYAMYFNKKYHRMGPLFNGKYKAVLIDTDEGLIHVSRHLHEKNKEKDTITSYDHYLGYANDPWIKKDHVLKHFITRDGSYTTESLYKIFVEKYKTSLRKTHPAYFLG